MNKLSTVLITMLYAHAMLSGQADIKDIRFGSTTDPLNGLTITWNSSGDSDKIAWGYTSEMIEGKFEGQKSATITGTSFEYTFPAVKASSLIYYKIFDSNKSVWTGEGVYRTASDATDDAFSFTVLGDSRTNPEEWKIISEATYDTDFTLFMGDIVARGKDASNWTDWFEYGSAFISREVVYHCVGNHDKDDTPSNFDNFMGLYTLPGNELYYTFNYGNAVFICLNSENPGDTEQYNWLLSTLEENKEKTWKVVFFHKPFYTAPSHTGEMDKYLDTWWKAFDDHGIDMIFNGHTHNYQRTVPINRNVSKDSGVASYGSKKGMGRCQVVAGNAGAPITDAANSDNWWLEKSEGKRHFCNVDIDGDKLTMKVYDANHTIIDELILVKNE